MALRQIRTQGDDILTKECRKVEKMTPKSESSLTTCLILCMKLTE